MKIRGITVAYAFPETQAIVCCNRWQCTAVDREARVPFGGIHELRKTEQGDWYTGWWNKRSSAGVWSLCGHKTGTLEHHKSFGFQICLCYDPHLCFMRFLLSTYLNYLFHWPNLTSTFHSGDVFAFCLGPLNSNVQPWEDLSDVAENHEQFRVLPGMLLRDPVQRNSGCKDE